MIFSLSFVRFSSNKQQDKKMPRQHPHHHPAKYNTREKEMLCGFSRSAFCTYHIHTKSLEQKASCSSNNIYYSLERGLLITNDTAAFA